MSARRSAFCAAMRRLCDWLDARRRWRLLGCLEASSEPLRESVYMLEEQEEGNILYSGTDGAGTAARYVFCGFLFFTRLTMTSVRVFPARSCGRWWGGGGGGRGRGRRTPSRQNARQPVELGSRSLGLVDEPASITERLRAELKELRAGLCTIIEANQGIPMEKPNDAKGLIGCLEN